MISGKMNTHHSLFNFIINGNNIGSRGTAKKEKTDKVQLHKQSHHDYFLYLTSSCFCVPKHIGNMGNTDFYWNGQKY